MKKNTFIPALMFVILAVVIIFFVSKDDTDINNENTALKTDIILFYGTGCQYCGVVEEFLEEKEVEKIISFKNLEVFNNKANATLLEAKARVCGLNTNSIGVPFLWDGQDCLIGDKAIIAFFENKLATIESLNPENAIIIDDFINEESVEEKAVVSEEVINEGVDEKELPNLEQE